MVEERANLDYGRDDDDLVDDVTRTDANRSAILDEPGDDNVVVEDDDEPSTYGAP